MIADKKIPALRFPEFDGEWQHKIGSQITIKITKGSSPNWQGFQYVSSGVLFVTSENVRDGFLDISSPKYLTEEFNKKQKNSQLLRGDLLINIVGASIGRSTIYSIPDKANINQAVAMFRIHSDYSIEFVSYYLQLGSTQSDLLGVQSASARPNLSLKNLNELSFYLPNKNEQQKIAAFLTSVDDKIQHLTKKKALLTQYKKGIMQQIFSQQIRFKDDDGEEYQDWKEKRLGDFGDFKNGLNKSKEDFGFGFPFINLMNVFGNSTILDEHFDLVNVNAVELKTYEIKKGDVLFIRSSVKRGGVGEASVVSDDLPNTVYSGFLIRFREKANESKMYAMFKKYCFADIGFRNKLLAKSTTSANTNINQESLINLSIRIPIFGEQKKIGDFLTSIDEKINTVNKQLVQTQQYKKGLLQQMFV